MEYYESVKDAVRFKSEAGELKYWKEGDTFTYMIKGDTDKCLIIRKPIKIGLNRLTMTSGTLGRFRGSKGKHETIETWINFLFRDHFNDIIDSKVFNDLIEPIEARNRSRAYSTVT